MNQAAKSKGILLFSLVIIGLLTGAGLIIRKVVYPRLEEKEQENLLKDTQSGKTWESAMKIAADPFSGYAVLRSPAVRDELETKRMRLVIEEDQADYGARMQALRDGKLDGAVMTVDATLINLGAFPGPAPIVFVIDESRGADAIVAYKGAVENTQALDRSGAKIVAVPDSPSETLARHMISRLVPSIQREPWLVSAESPTDVLLQLRKSNAQSVQAFALWEPQLSQALKVPGVHRVYGSDMTSGVIVDVLVVRREYLKEHPEQVRSLTEAYFNALSAARSQPTGMRDLVIADAKSLGTDLTNEEADNIVKGIHWANTQENYVYMSIPGALAVSGVRPLSEIITRVASFLVKTGKLPNNPSEGREHELYFDGIVKQLSATRYMPASGPEVSGGNAELPVLSEADWNTKLTHVGDMDTTRIEFRTGSAELSTTARTLIGLIVDELREFPTFYVEVTGTAVSDADPEILEASRKLAEERANAVVHRLNTLGIKEARMRTRVNVSDGTRNVTFRLFQRSY